MLSASERDAGALWTAALDALAGRASPRARARLAAASAALELQPRALRVCAYSTELHDAIASGALSLLRRAIARLTDGAQALAIAPLPPGSDLTRDPRRDFASFIPGPANAPVRDRVRELAERGAASRPLLLHGAAGSGKTHLLRCAAAALRDRLGESAGSFSGEMLVLQLVEALWNDALGAFRRQLEQAGALLIDGLEALEGKDATQQELVRALESALARRVPVLLASTRPAAQLRQIVPELAAQLERAETLELAAPGWELRVAIVLDRIRAWQVRSTPEVASYLATALRSDLERLDSVLTTLMAEAGAARGLDDPGLIQQILASDSRPERPPAPEEVIELVARHFGIRLRELRSPSRLARASTPRQIAIYLLRRHCGLSYPEVGRHFRRHHTTALHADRRVQRQLETDAGLRSTVVLLEKELRSRAERGR